MKAKSIWAILGIKRTRETAVIRRAYAQKLKVTNPEDDAAGFKVLRAAYEQALSYSKSQPSKRNFNDEELDKFELADIANIENANPGTMIYGKAQEKQPTEIYNHLHKLGLILQRDQTSLDHEALDIFKEIIASPDFENLGIRDEIECRIASLICNNFPRSDDLVKPVMREFKWVNSRYSQNASWEVQTIIQRKADLEFSKLQFGQNTSDSSVFSILKQPPKPIGIWYRATHPFERKEIIDTINLIRNEHTTMINDLNQKTVEFWETFNEKPRLPDWSLWGFVFSPIWLAFCLWVWIQSNHHWGSLVFFAIIPTCTIALGLGYCFGYQYPKAFFIKRYSYFLPNWIRLGFWPLSMGLCLVGTLIPNDPNYWPASLLVVVFAIFAVIWALSVKNAEYHFAAEPFSFWLFLPDIIVVIWWLFLAFKLAPVQYLPMTAAILSLGTISSTMRSPAFYYVDSLQKNWRNILIFSVVPISLISSWFLVSKGLQPPKTSTLLAFVMIIFSNIISRIIPTSFQISLEAWTFRLLILGNFAARFVAHQLEIPISSLYFLFGAFLFTALILARSFSLFMNENYLSNKM